MAEFKKIDIKAILHGKIPSKLFRATLVLALALIVYLFWSLLDKQNSSLNTNAARDRLTSEGLARETGKWEVSLQKCTEADGVRSCEVSSSEKFSLTFPARSQILKINSKIKTESNLATLTYALTEDDRKWLERNATVVLMFPRSIHNAVRMKLAGRTVEQFGLGSDATFSLYSGDLLEAGKLNLEIDFEGFDYFGPADLPVTFLAPDSAGEYASLTHKQVSAGNLSRQIQLGFPVLLAAMAIVLDHSRAFAFLSLFAGSNALRSYVPFLIENGTELTPLLQNIGYVASGLNFAFLILFALEIANVQGIKTRYKLALVPVSALATVVVGFFYQGFWLNFDLWGDFLGCAVALPLGVYGLFSIVRERNKLEDRKSKQENEGDATLSFALMCVRTGLIIFALSIHGWANAADLLQLATTSFKNTLDWKHQLLSPALVIAGLIELGSTAKKMSNFGKQMAHKALLEQELIVGKEVQQKMLPPKRFSNLTWQWRSFYKPATALAGDWYDVRELTFKDGKQMLAVCVADVTGHGVGSSLATSVICSHWSLWCKEIQTHDCPVSAAEREGLIISAPGRIHDGLLALRENEQCTAMFVLIDPDAQEITACSGGHPGVIMSNDSEVRYLTSQGERLGVDLGNRPEWRAKTDKVSALDSICVYSDGLVPPDTTLSSWTGGLRRKCRKTPAPLDLLLLKQLRFNRSYFQDHHDVEDDLTLVTIRLKATQTQTARLDPDLPKAESENPDTPTSAIAV